MSSSLNDPMSGKVGSTARDKEIALRPNIQYTHLVTFHEDDMLPFRRRLPKNFVSNPSMEEKPCISFGDCCQGLYSVVEEVLIKLQYLSIRIKSSDIVGSDILGL